MSSSPARPAPAPPSPTGSPIGTIKHYLAPRHAKRKKGPRKGVLIDSKGNQVPPPPRALPRPANHPDVLLAPQRHPFVKNPEAVQYLKLEKKRKAEADHEVEMARVRKQQRQEGEARGAKFKKDWEEGLRRREQEAVEQGQRKLVKPSSTKGAAPSAQAGRPAHRST